MLRQWLDFIITHVSPRFKRCAHTTVGKFAVIYHEFGGQGSASRGCLWDTVPRVIAFPRLPGNFIVSLFCDFRGRSLSSLLFEGIITSTSSMFSSPAEFSYSSKSEAVLPSIWSSGITTKPCVGLESVPGSSSLEQFWSLFLLILACANKSSWMSSLVRAEKTLCVVIAGAT